MHLMLYINYIFAREYLFLKMFILFLIMCICLFVFMWICTHECRCYGSQKRASDFLEVGYRWLWVAHHECRELNTDLLQEKLALLNVKPYLQPNKDLFYRCILCVGIRHLCYRWQIYILWESLCAFSHPFHTGLVLSMWSNTLPNKEKQSLQDCSAAWNTEPS